MQKLNLNHIPEAPENKDFWVVGTANREGSIDSNSYKKNLAKIGGNLEDMTANMTTEQKMQARKNLGLYYEETQIAEKSLLNVEFPEESIGWVKFSDDTPTKEDIIKVIWDGRDNEEFIPGVALDGDTLNFSDIANGYELILSGNSLGEGVTQPFFRVITSGDDAGIYGYSTTGGATLYYNYPIGTAFKIDEMYLPSNVLELTNLPTTSGTRTQAELDAMGLTAENIKKICEGRITHFKQAISDTDYLIPLVVDSHITDEFWGVHIVNGRALPETYMFIELAATSQGYIQLNVKEDKS